MYIGGVRAAAYWGNSVQGLKIHLQRKKRTITPEGEAWIRGMSARSPGEFGYRSEAWDLTLLAFHVRACCRAAGHPTLAGLTYRNLSNLLACGPEPEGEGE